MSASKPIRLRTRNAGATSSNALQNTPTSMAKFETWRIDKLHPTPSPVRTRGKNQAGAIAASISRFGFVSSIIVTPEGEIVDGHGAFEAAKEAGYTEVPVAVVEGRTEEEIKALRIGVNRLGERGVWEPEALAAHFKLIWESDPLLATFTGFEMPEFDRAMEFVKPVAGEEKVPPLEPDAVSRLGDLWTFKGGSRLLCGDAKDPASYDRVLEGLTVQMVLSDPPYGIAIKKAVKKQREFVQGSGMSAEKRLAFFRDFLAAAGPHIPDGCIVDLFMDDRGLLDLLTASGEAGLELVCLAAWHKGSAMGAPYRRALEHIAVLKRPGASHIDNVKLGTYDRNRTTLWSAPGNASFNKDRKAALARHPTCKPVSLLKDAILDTSYPGGVILEMFAGSGSTLVAAYHTKRIGIGIELDPNYCDVSVRRMQEATGEPAVHSETGLTFDETAARRLADPAAQ